MKNEKQSRYVVIPFTLMLLEGMFFGILFSYLSNQERFFLIKRSSIIMGIVIGIGVSYELRENIKKMMIHCAMVSAAYIVAILLLYLCCGMPKGQLEMDTILIFTLLPFAILFLLRIQLSIFEKIFIFLDMEKTKKGLVYLSITKPLTIKEENFFFLTHCFGSIGFIIAWGQILMRENGWNSQTKVSLVFLLVLGIGAFLFHKSIARRERRG